MYLPGSAKFIFNKDINNQLQHTPGSAVSAGDLVRIGGILDGIAMDDIAANRTGLVDLGSGLWYGRCAAATTFSIGDTVYYDNSAGLCVAPALTLDGDADVAMGIAVQACSNTQNGVLFRPFLSGVPNRYQAIQPIVYEFDVDVAGDQNAKVIIDATQNRHGLVYVNSFVLVTEQPAGTSEDQLILAMEDTDDTEICTFTTTDTTPDEAGDIIIGSPSLCNDDSADLSGTAWKTVAAGKGVQAKLTQITAGGTIAGKVKGPYVQFLPLV